MVQVVKVNTTNASVHTSTVPSNTLTEGRLLKFQVVKDLQQNEQKF